MTRFAHQPRSEGVSDAKAKHSTCWGCKFAKWDRTDSGRLHVYGQGRCMFKFPPMPPVPMWATDAANGWKYDTSRQEHGGYFIDRRASKWAIEEPVCPTREPGEYTP